MRKWGPLKASHIRQKSGNSLETTTALALLSQGCFTTTKKREAGTKSVLHGETLLAQLH